jgi:hypothetical protein
VNVETLLKEMERKLLIEWLEMRLLKDPGLIEKAIDAYYVNYRIYQKEKAYTQKLK